MKKGLIITDYWLNTGIWNFAIDLYESLKDDIYIDFLNLYNLKWFKGYPKKGNNLDVWNFYIWFFLGFTWIKLKKYLLNNDYDFIILPHQGMWYIIPYLKQVNIEIITVLHDLTSYTIYKKNFLHIVFRFFSIKHIIKSNKIIFTSKITKEDFFFEGFKFNWKTKIIHEYIDDNKYYKIWNNNLNYYSNIQNNISKTLIAVTNWQPHKNDITFFKIASEYPKYLFIKVWYISKECLKYIEEKKLNNIKLFNRVSLKELRELYNISDIYINTSLKEWFGYPPHESLFCWTKLLTTKSIDIKLEKWIYILDDYFDIRWYKKWIKILLNETLNFKNIYEYKSDVFKKKFIDFIKF